MKYLEDASGFGNDIIYQMCKEYPLHNNTDIVYGKIWLIGHAYSASIERTGRKGFKVKIEDVANLLIDNKIDDEINKLKGIDRTTEENINTLLSVHSKLITLFEKATFHKKRSLASKYLHFHAPKSVFIFDSIANDKLKKIEILKSNKNLFKAHTKDSDNEYESFVRRCIYYRDNVLEKELNGGVTPRFLDMKLLSYKKF